MLKRRANEANHKLTSIYCDADDSSPRTAPVQAPGKATTPVVESPRITIWNRLMLRVGQLLSRPKSIKVEEADPSTGKTGKVGSSFFSCRAWVYILVLYIALAPFWLPSWSWPFSSPEPPLKIGVFYFLASPEKTHLDNFEFFVRHGKYSGKEEYQVDVYVILSEAVLSSTNQPEFMDLHNGWQYIHAPASCDSVGHAAQLLAAWEEGGSPYDRAIVLDSTARGPFMPIYFQKYVSWVDIMLRRLDEKFAMVSSTMRCLPADDEDDGANEIVANPFAFALNEKGISALVLAVQDTECISRQTDPYLIMKNVMRSLHDDSHSVTTLQYKYGLLDLQAAGGLRCSSYDLSEWTAFGLDTDPLESVFVKYVDKYAVMSWASHEAVRAVSRWMDSKDTDGTSVRSNEGAVFELAVNSAEVCYVKQLMPWTCFDNKYYLETYEDLRDPLVNCIAPRLCWEHYASGGFQEARYGRFMCSMHSPQDRSVYVVGYEPDQQALPLCFDGGSNNYFVQVGVEETTTPGAWRHQAERIFKSQQEAQRQVAVQWPATDDQIDALVCQGAGVYDAGTGTVEKKAPGSAITLTGNDWGNVDMFAAVGLPIYSGTQVFISHKYKFIYIRQQRAASVTILSGIQKLFCKGDVCTEEEFVQTYYVDDPTWNKYFVFTVVRNPFARALSTYLYFTQQVPLRMRQPGTEEPGPVCTISFEEFTNDSFNLRRKCSTEGCCVYIEAVKTWIFDFVNAPITQQAHSIFTAKGLPVVDFIGRVESLATDWQTIVSNIEHHSGLSVKHCEIQDVAGRRKEVDLSLHPCLEPSVANMHLLNFKTMRAIAHQYALDFTWLQFPPISPNWEDVIAEGEIRPPFLTIAQATQNAAVRPTADNAAVTTAAAVIAAEVTPIVTPVEVPAILDPLAQSAPVAGAWSSAFSVVAEKWQLAKDKVMSQWEMSDKLVCQGAKLHGIVPKIASGSAVPFLENDWDSVSMYAKAGIPVYAGAMVYISDKHKFIYIRQPRASSSSILAAIQRLYCGGKECPDEIFRQAHNIDDATWKAYFVFTVVRNPIARMLSTFVFFHQELPLYTHVKNSDEPGEACSITFPAFATDSFRLREICDSQGCCVYIAAMKTWVPDFVNAHISQQAHLVFTPAGDSIVDYIGRTENIQEDWAEIVANIQTRSGLDVGTAAMENVNGRHTAIEVSPEEQHPCLPVDRAQMKVLEPPAILGITLQHALDFRLFGFLPEE